MEFNITKEVIFSYFAGSCTTLQKGLIDDWVKDDVNREQFFEWLYEWEKKNAQYQVNVEEGLNRHRRWVQSLSEQPTVEVFDGTPVKSFLSTKIVAAACGILLTIVVGWLSKDSIANKTYQTASGEIKKITLSDGSKVVLNANSTFRVPRFGFGKNTREVLLTGEASFDVVHTKNDTRFVVQTDQNMNIEVLGTEFNVYSRSSGTQVVLNTGQIQLHYSNGKQKRQLTLTPGDLVSMDSKGTIRKSHTSAPENYSAWKYHRFIFENQPFKEICNRLEETFGKKISIQDEGLAGQVISGSFTALDAEELLDLLGEAGHFTYSNNSNKIIISKDTVFTEPELLKE